MADQASPTKRTLTPEAMTYLENLVQADPMLGNAFRLMNDASFLFDGGRYSSTVALAVLSMEETGKYLLARWSKIGMEDVGSSYPLTKNEVERWLRS